MLRTLCVSFLLVAAVAAQPADVLRKVTAEGSWSTDQARAFLTALYSDERLTAEEVSWLKTLTSNSTPELCGVKVPAPQGYQRELLTYLVGKPNLNELYDGTQEQMRLLSDLSSIGPKARERAVKVFASRIQAVWQSSSVDNKFDPITQELGRAYNKLKPLPEPTRKLGLQLLHEACTLARDDQKGPMPTYLYNWVVADYK